MAKHTDEEIEIFAQELAITDDPNAAYMKAKPNTKAKPQSVYSLSCRMAKLPEVVKRVSELKSQIKVKAESKFSITVEKRLEWLKDIVEAGLGTYIDQQGNSRREGLAAARASIQTMNEMLGVGVDDDDSAKPLEIHFTVSQPVGKIEITKGD